ncbi:MAG: VOC family protein [Hyphomicrobiaceae bacterium]|nr:VOC family protein [Hyphomicrobiaceae bacterium]
MIIPNLMVADMARSLAFYRGVIGLKLVTAVSPSRELLTETDGSDAAFVILSSHDGGELMLQTTSSLRDEHPTLPPQPVFAGTLYLRGHDPREIWPKLSPVEIAQEPALQWYGMLEGYVRDPDGTLVCLGIPDGPAPT